MQEHTYEGDMIMKKILLEEAKNSSTLSKELISNLLETMDYTSMSFLDWAIDVLKVLKVRIDRGDKIQDAVSGVTYDKASFQEFVKKNFSSYVHSQVFASPDKMEKAYFSLKACEGGYNLVLAASPKEKTYEWISSLSKRFSIVKMIATDIVYIKDMKNNSYTPFISENGKYCRYCEKEGKIFEV